MSATTSTAFGRGGEPRPGQGNPGFPTDPPLDGTEQEQQLEVLEQEGTGAGSLKDRLARRREELRAERKVVLPVTGYEDEGLYVRYKVLTYRQLRAIGKRLERVADTPEGELALAQDTLIYACETLLERLSDDEDGRPVYRELGMQWSSQTATELFGVGATATAREALTAIFPEMDLIMHFREYDSEVTAIHPEVEKLLSGESEPSLEG